MAWGSSGSEREGGSEHSAPRFFATCGDRTRLRSVGLSRGHHEEGGRCQPGRGATTSGFRLSDDRGKVVVLTFSGNWCGPGRAMYPRERALVNRLRDRPFALLSVNTDENDSTLKKSIREGEITWRCWWDRGPDEPITTRWGVENFPTLYLIDQKGVLRQQGYVRGDELDNAVDELLAKGS
ncbi:MAG: TlpA family protein disulfide reductase [Isosphaeraceae bacterium]